MRNACRETNGAFVTFGSHRTWFNANSCSELKKKLRPNSGAHMFIEPSGLRGNCLDPSLVSQRVTDPLVRTVLLEGLARVPQVSQVSRGQLGSAGVSRGHRPVCELAEVTERDSVGPLPQPSTAQPTRGDRRPAQDRVNGQVPSGKPATVTQPIIGFNSDQHITSKGRSGHLIHRRYFSPYKIYQKIKFVYLFI